MLSRLVVQCDTLPLGSSGRHGDVLDAMFEDKRQLGSMRGRRGRRPECRNGSWRRMKVRTSETTNI